MDGEVQVIHFLMHTLAPAGVSTASYWVGVLLVARAVLLVVLALT